MQQHFETLIHQALQELDGLEFADSKKYSSKAVIFFIDRYNTILSMIRPLRPDHKVLEVGLAGGVLALALQRAFHLKELHTLEHPVASSLYTAAFRKAMKKNHISLKEADLREAKLPWKSNTFDYILFSEVIEHLVPADLPAILRELHRVLKKGGTLLVTTPNVASLLKRINLLRGKNPVEFDLNIHEGATYGHIREYTQSELLEALSNVGFSVQRKGFFTIDRQRSIFTKIEGAAADLLPFLANNLSFHVTK